MDLLSALNIGSFYQNVAFYAFLTLLVCLNFDVLKFRGKQKEFKSIVGEQ